MHDLCLPSGLDILCVYMHARMREIVFKLMFIISDEEVRTFAMLWALRPLAVELAVMLAHREYVHVNCGVNFQCIFWLEDLGDKFYMLLSSIIHFYTKIYLATLQSRMQIFYSC